MSRLKAQLQEVRDGEQASRQAAEQTLAQLQEEFEDGPQVRRRRRAALDRATDIISSSKTWSKRLVAAWQLLPWSCLRACGEHGLLPFRPYARPLRAA